MKVLVFLADGFEEVEALTVVDYLRRMDINVETISITGDTKVRGAHDIRVIADKTIDKLESIESYDGLIIPGGLPGASNLRDDERVVNAVKSAYTENKLVAAICAGPIVLERAGILIDKDVTSYPGFGKQLKGVNYRVEAVVVDKNIITSRGPHYAVDFAIEIVSYLLGEEKAEELKGHILYNEVLLM